MPTPRRDIVDPDHSGFYHCTSRCCRKLFLMGEGYEHRRDWLRERMFTLAETFAIDVVSSLAALSNHMHHVIRTLPELVETWSDREVVHRWHLLKPDRAFRDREEIDAGVPPTLAEINQVLRDPERVKELRKRLSDLGWYMRELKEPLARLANREDEVTGHYWESRYDSRPVTGVSGLMLCSAYVELNPVKAGVSKSTLASEHTSAEIQLAKATRAALWREVICGGAGGGASRNANAGEGTNDRGRRRAAATTGKRTERSAPDHGGGSPATDHTDAEAGPPERRRRPKLGQADLDAILTELDDRAFEPAVFARREVTYPVTSQEVAQVARAVAREEAEEGARCKTCGGQRRSAGAPSRASTHGTRGATNRCDGASATSSDPLLRPYAGEPSWSFVAAEPGLDLMAEIFDKPRETGSVAAGSKVEPACFARPTASATGPTARQAGPDEPRPRPMMRRAIEKIRAFGRTAWEESVALVRSLTILPMSLGAYLRRMEALGLAYLQKRRERDEAEATGAASRRKRRRHRRGEHDQPGPHQTRDSRRERPSTLPAITGDARSVVAMLQSIEFWGSTIGDRIEMAREARRRGLSRVVQAPTRSRGRGELGERG